MTVNTATASQSYTGNGVTQVFAIPFYFLVDTDLIVTRKVAITGVISTLVLNSDYTLSGSGNPAGGSLTMLVAPANLDQISINRNVVLVQQTAYPVNDKFPATSHERALDRLTMIAQQQADQISRSLVRSPLGSGYDLGGGSLINGAPAVNAADIPTLVQVQGLIVGGAAPALAGDNGSALIGFKQAGTGAVSRTVQDKLRDIVSVKDFGAKGDGVTDDTVAIQAAINYASTFASGFGGEVVFPSGQYNYSALTITSQGVSLRGEGKVGMVKMTSSGNGILISGNAGRIYGINFSNLTFSAGVAQSSGAAIYMTNTGQCKMDNITFTSYPFPNYRGLQTNNVSQITIDAMVCQNCVDSGFVFTDMIDIYAINCRSDANGLHGFFFDTCSGVYFTACTAFSNNGSGWYTQKIAAGVIATTNNYYFMTACVGDTNGSNNWTLNSLGQSELTACWGSTQKNTTANLNGFALDGNCNNVEINGCMALTNNNAGLLVLNGATDIVVRGGIWMSNGRVAGSSQRHGIWSDAASISVLGTRCQDILSPKMQLYGVYVNSGTNVLIKDNNLVGNLTGGLNINGSLLGLIERDNIVGTGIPALTAAAALALPVVGDTFIINGTTGITSITGVYAARRVTLIFNNTLTMTDGSNLKLAGNFTSTGVYSTITLVSPDGVNWAEVSRSVN